MKRIESAFAALNRPALITFVMAGDPDHETSLRLLKALPAAGADIIELGMPFSDPVADGPVIQAAGLRALRSGASMIRTLALVREFRKYNSDTPLVLMGYANPILAYGYENFSHDAAQAGVDGLIMVDLPPEEDAELRKAADEAGLELIRLIAPTTGEDRLSTLLQDASGFIYYISVAGITGATKIQAESIEPHIRRIRALTSIPIVIGFGIKTPQDASEMAALADGIVVGSAVVKTIEDNLGDSSLVEILSGQVGELRYILCNKNGLP